MLCSACAPSSGWAPFQASFIDPAQIFSESTDVYGLRFNLFYGSNADLYGIDVGLVGSAEAVGGIQGSLANYTEELVGVQIAGVHNKSERVVGLQFASLINETEELTGLQIGLLNFNRGGPLPVFPIVNFGFGSAPEESTASED